MAQTILSINDFISKLIDEKLPVIDARSESEFFHASVPGAVNIPLLNDENRKIVGTLYKQKGREAAILKGFEVAGSRFHLMILKALEFAPDKKVMMYCWRGGMRSSILAWILGMNGFTVYLLKGGYKAYRNWILDTLKVPKKVLVLGGATGSGKTEILNLLSQHGEQTIDLEALANHKGSAFGSLGKGAQPFNEMFENCLAMEWNLVDHKRHVWLENESRSIGSCMVPSPIYDLIRNAELIEINVGDEARKKRIARDYGCFPVKVLSDITNKLSKRMGPQHAKEAIGLLESGDFNGWLEKVLVYYDKLYNYGNSLRAPEKIHAVDLIGKDDQEVARILIDSGNKVMKTNSLQLS